MLRWMRRAGIMASVALLLWCAGCGGGGNGEDDPGPQPVLEGDEAVAATLGVVQSTIAALVGLRTEEFVFSAEETCSAGSVDGSCEVRNAQSIVHASFDQCRIALSAEYFLIGDGDLRIEASDPSTCVTGTIGESATIRTDFVEFVDVLVDAAGNELYRSRANGSDLIVRSGSACGRVILERIDATIDVVSNLRFPGRLVTDGADQHLTMRDLQLDQSFVGRSCRRTLSADGQMDIDDRALGLRFSQTLRGVTVSVTAADDAELIGIDGDIDNACVGAVTVTTVEPIRMRNATDCPTGGILHVTREGRTSEMRFGPGGGFSIDFGNRLIVGSDCRSIAQCSR